MPLRRPAVPAAALLLAAASVAVLPPPAAALVTGLQQRYEITATLDVASRRLDAEMEITLTNRSARALEHVDLVAVPRALGFFSLTGDVKVGGVPVEPNWTTSINLRVPLDALGRGAATTITVPFRLEVGRATDAFTARTSAENGVLSFGQWFPIVSLEHEVHGIGDPQISFTADSIRLDLATTAPLPRDAVACPGLVDAPAGSGTAWSCESADVRDFSFVVNPRFRLTERTAGATLVRAFTETVDGAETVRLASEAVERFGELYGPYPWPDLVLAEVGSATGFSMEYPRMIHLTRDKVADPYVVYHEVAHQWFYAQVGNEQQAEPWLDEALADFSARRLMGIGENHCSSRPVNSDVFAWPAGPIDGGDWTSCDGYFHAVFYRGTEFLTALRSTMGDESFDEAMRSWVSRNRFGFGTEARLLGHLEASSAADLGGVFDAYLVDYEVEPPKPAATIQRAG